jgi:dihydrofolate synthase/folylpolyglutamate synthase
VPNQKQELKPTVFEVLTAVAFWYFAKRKVDYAVVEVGMGGRLDATNVITPLVSVITNVELEHTKILGNTLAKIAAEKAAIIKPGVPSITAEWKGEALRVIKDEAKRKNSLLVQVSGEQRVESRKQKAEHWNLLGKHQAVNAACAISAIRLAGIKVSRQEIGAGLRKVKWPARFQIVSKKPLVIVDGAHNPAGCRTLVSAVKKLYPGQRFTIIFGCQNDKDFPQMIKTLKPITNQLIITHSSHPNSLGTRYSLPVTRAIKSWDRKVPLLIAGSLFLAADALKILDA